MEGERERKKYIYFGESSLENWTRDADTGVDVMWIQNKNRATQNADNGHSGYLSYIKT